MSSSFFQADRNFLKGKFIKIQSLIKNLVALSVFLVTASFLLAGEITG